MSFGFSPGDIVMFGNFLLKVRGALKEDGGSRVQYLRAMKQCSDFDGVLNSIRKLDLSNATESFKEQLKKCTFDTQGVINDFRRTVAHYEKSMGESSSRGIFASAPRKIQWVFDAADDLDDFRKRLQSQVDRIQITLQGNTW